MYLRTASLRRIGVLAFAGVAALVGSQSAQGQALYGNEFDGTLYDVNPLTGATSNPRETGITNLNGIDMSPSGVLYGLNAFISSSQPNSLFSINPTTGASTLIGATGLTDIFEGGLAFNPAGTLYGIQNLTGSLDLSLFTISTVTGAATVVGNIAGAQDLSALAFSNAGTLYVIDTAANTLLTVNPANAAVLGTVPLSVNLGDTAGFDINLATGVAYVVDGNNGGTNSLYTLNLATGAMSLVGPTGRPLGLAGLTVVPEPATASLFAAAALSVLARRRRA